MTPRSALALLLPAAVGAAATLLGILVGICQPAIAEPVLHCGSSGCAWVEEVDPVPGVSLYQEQRSTRSIPAELWMPAPKAAPTVVQPAPSVVYLRDHRRQRHGDPLWKQACRARGAYPSSCLPTAYGRRDHGGRHHRQHVGAATLPAKPVWPVGLSQLGQGRER